MVTEKWKRTLLNFIPYWSDKMFVFSLSHLNYKRSKGTEKLQLVLPTLYSQYCGAFNTTVLHISCMWVCLCNTDRKILVHFWIFFFLWMTRLVNKGIGKKKYYMKDLGCSEAKEYVYCHKFIRDKYFFNITCYALQFERT